MHGFNYCGARPVPKYAVSSRTRTQGSRDLPYKAGHIILFGKYKVDNGSMLTLRTLGTSASGPATGSEPDRYEVIGLPAGRGAMLARLSGVWKILKIEAGKHYAWTGSFVSADDALTSLEGDVSTSN